MIYQLVSYLKKLLELLHDLKQVFSKYAHILHRPRMRASTSILCQDSCFCLEHQNIRGIQKKKCTKNQTDIRFRLKQQNIYYFGCMTSPNCQSSIFQFKTSYWYVLITIGILFKITLRILIGRSTISCETLANILGITEKMHGAEHSTHLVTMY